jgi:hypothetical protein
LRANKRVIVTELLTDRDFEVVEYCGRLSCRNPIVQTAGRGRRREFCSETCRRGADRDYKRAKALVETFERNLRNFRHEVAAYGRKSETDGTHLTLEDRALRQSEALAAFSRAEAVLEFGTEGLQDPYYMELKRLVDAIKPVLGKADSRATA